MSLDKNSDCGNKTEQKTAEMVDSELSSSSKVKRRVNWIPNSDKETFRTVVVNYHYAKSDRFRRSIASIPKKRNTWSKMLAKMAAKRAQDEANEEQGVTAIQQTDKVEPKQPSLEKILVVSEEKLKKIDSESIPNLKKFFEISKEELLKASKENMLKESKSESVYNLRLLYELSKEKLLSASKSDSGKKSKFKDNFMDADEEAPQIKVEVYRFPSKPKSLPEKEAIPLPPPMQKSKTLNGNSKTDLPRHPVFIDPEVIIISDDEDHDDKLRETKYEQAEQQTEPQNQTDQESQTAAQIPPPPPPPLRARNSKELITEKVLQKSLSGLSQKANKSTVPSLTLKQRQNELVII